MRILIVTDAWHPQVNGVVRTLEKVIEGMDALGHEIRLVTPEGYCSLPMPSYPEIRLSLTAALPMRRTLIRHEPDAVHIATEGPLGIAARKACIQLGWPFSTSYHTRFPEYLNARIPVPVEWTYAWLRRFHNSGCGCLVATKSIADELSRRGFRRLVPWTRGVDHELFHPSRRNLAGELAGLARPIFLNVGRVSVEKNLDAFLELDLPGTKVVVGDGPDLLRLKAAHPKAVFTGVRIGLELAEIYASADVFVFPSLTDTFGNVIIEALASGLPVAAFPVPGPVDILTDPAAGVLDQDLGRACLAAAKLDGRAARKASRSYTWKNTTAIMLDLMQKNRVRPVHAEAGSMAV